MPPTNTFPTYESIGFSGYMERGIVDISTSTPASLTTSSNQNINFDNAQTSGNLGSKIVVGKITIDGVAGRIIVSDGNNDIIIIGELS